MPIEITDDVTVPAKIAVTTLAFSEMPVTHGHVDMSPVQPTDAASPKHTWQTLIAGGISKSTQKRNVSIVQ